MTKKDKIIQKIKSLKAISSNQAEILLESIGYTGNKTASSHITYRKNDSLKITIVKNQKEMLPYQLKELKALLESEGY